MQFAGVAVSIHDKRGVCLSWRAEKTGQDANSSYTKCEISTSTERGKNSNIIPQVNFSDKSCRQNDVSYPMAQKIVTH